MGLLTIFGEIKSKLSLLTFERLATLLHGIQQNATPLASANNLIPFYNVLTSGSLTLGRKYEILANTGANFVTGGSANNTVGTQFTATATSVTWGTGGELAEMKLDGAILSITGNTEIQTISKKFLHNGSKVRLIFDEACTIKHNETTSGDACGIILNSAADTTADAGSEIELQLRSDDYWYQIAGTGMFSGNYLVETHDSFVPDEDIPANSDKVFSLRNNIASKDKHLFVTINGLVICSALQHAYELVDGAYEYDDDYIHFVIGDRDVTLKQIPIPLDSSDVIEIYYAYYTNETPVDPPVVVPGTAILTYEMQTPVVTSETSVKIVCKVTNSGDADIEEYVKSEHVSENVIPLSAQIIRQGEYVFFEQEYFNLSVGSHDFKFYQSDDTLIDTETIDITAPSLITVRRSSAGYTYGSMYYPNMLADIYHTTGGNGVVANLIYLNFQLIGVLAGFTAIKLVYPNYKSANRYISVYKCADSTNPSQFLIASAVQNVANYITNKNITVYDSSLRETEIDLGATYVAWAAGRAQLSFALQPDASWSQVAMSEFKLKFEY